MKAIETINQNGETRESGLMLASRSFAADRKTMEDRLGQLKELRAGVSIAPRYYEFLEKGEKTRGIFLGFLKLEKTNPETGEVKEIDSIAWMDETQTIYQNAGTQLVGAFSSNNLKQGTPVEIEFLGEKKLALGKMKQYAVRPLFQDEPESPAAK